MTEAEKKEIVALVMSEISGQAVDFDLQTVTPQRTDILPAVRPDGAGGYTGVTLNWGGITDELTTQAKGFRNEALQAKRDTELLKSETNGIKSEVNDIYTQFNQVVDSTIESVRNVYQSDLNAESTARQTADNTLQQNIDSEASTRAEADTSIGARIDSETTTRESEVAELERVNAIQKYEIENLKAKAEGKLYRTETVKAEAYALDVPSSVAPYAEVQKIGGKSVVWNQLIRGFSSTFWEVTTAKATDISFGDNSVEFTPTAKYSFIIQKSESRFDTITGHKYFLSCEVTLTTGTDLVWLQLRNHSETATKKQIITANTTNKQILQGVYSETNGERVYVRVIDTRDSGWDKIKVANAQFIDLTQMFGSGNEPTLEECQRIFSADYYPYDEGTIKSFPVKRVRSVNAEGTEIGSMDISSFTSDLKSVPDVYDFWQNGKVTRNVKSITFDGSSDEKWLVYNPKEILKQKYITIDDFKYLSNKKIVMCAGYTSILSSNREGNFNTVYEWMDGVCFNTNESLEDFKARIQSSPITVYYSCVPTEETIPEIDNYINVEGGGTLTFESDGTIHMPIPNKDRFVVDLT